MDNQRLGAALAAEFSSGPYGLRRNDSDTQGLPDHSVVLMQSHGFTACATDLKVVVYQGIYAVINGRIESEALRIQHAYTGRAATAAGRGGGRHGGGGHGHGDEGGIVYLTPRQVRDTWETMIGTIERPWALWEREVRVDPLYVNELED